MCGPLARCTTAPPRAPRCGWCALHARGRLLDLRRRSASAPARWVVRIELAGELGSVQRARRSSPASLVGWGVGPGGAQPGVCLGTAANARQRAVAVFEWRPGRLRVRRPPPARPCSACSPASCRAGGCGRSSWWRPAPRRRRQARPGDGRVLGRHVPAMLGATTLLGAAAARAAGAAAGGDRAGADRRSAPPRCRCAGTNAGAEQDGRRARPRLPRRAMAP
jgi:hypothetical protein